MKKSFVLIAMLAASAGAFSQNVSTPQEQAEFLAGIPLPRSSPLRALQLSPQYRAHQDQLRDQWAFCRQVRYEAMRRWGAEHLASYPVTRGVLRYLFGGPDFLNAYAFFPDTRVMVLGGLEPVGDVPPPEGLSPGALGPALQALDEALHTSLFAGYFITTEMKPQLAQGAFRGVLPVLYTELALTGNIIDAVSMERPFGSSGVRITYHRTGGPQQTLWYFQADLSNGKECRRFLSWLGDLGPGASYLKAASYLLPLNSFSETRDFLIRTSELILQDDSGLPYRSFVPGEWRLSLYGVYTDPLPIFKLQRDPALTEAYASPLRVGSLPFGAGYHVRASDANLLLAVRDNTAILPQNPVQEAPPALPAFAAPTPPTGRGRVRKAKPVPIRKAIPVVQSRPVPTPVSMPVAPAPPPPQDAPTIAPPPSPQASTEPAPTPVVDAVEATTSAPVTPPAPEATSTAAPETPPVPLEPPAASEVPAQGTETPAIPCPGDSVTPVASPSMSSPSAAVPPASDPVQEAAPVAPAPVTSDGKPID